MKHPLLVLCIIFLCYSGTAQNNELLPYQSYFNDQLKPWATGFSNFKLSNFKRANTLVFENNYPKDINTYNDFLSIYRPFIVYSPSKAKFIDIYSYQLNIEKKGDNYYANPQTDQAIFLYDEGVKYWNRIYFGSSSEWIDEAIWLTDTTLLLAGISKSENNKKIPIVFLGNTNRQTLIKYTSSANNSFQQNKTYLSPRLKKLKVKNL